MASISDSVSVSKRGQTLHSQARGIIWNVYNYFKSQSGETGIYELLDRTAVATNVSPYSVRRIVEAGKAGLASSDAGCCCRGNLIHNAGKEEATSRAGNRFGRV